MFTRYRIFSSKILQTLATMPRKFYLYLLMLVFLLNVYWLFGIYRTSTYKHSTIKSELENRPCANLRYEFLKLYPGINQCVSPNNSNWTKGSLNGTKMFFRYSDPASEHIQQLRIARAVLIYFPMDNFGNYMSELRWLYRSWIEMMKHEPAHWRTDLVVFTDASKMYTRQVRELESLNCSAKNMRSSKEDTPMCTLVNAPPIKNRHTSGEMVYFASKNDLYHYFLNDVNIFDTENTRPFDRFYRELREKLKNYPNLESILVAFEAYPYLKSGQFDFALKTDIDVFLTPLFGKWMPLNCNDFHAGNGGYSTQFNLRRLKRVAKDLNLKHASVMNFGSTWFGTPDQFRIVSYLAMFSMLYLSEEEFSPTEQEGKLGTLHWPYWHYGVLSMYGSDLAINHFKATREFRVVKLDELFDYPTANEFNVNEKIHLHVFHGEDLFSKFRFKAGFYDNFNISAVNTTMIKYYTLKMALESKSSTTKQLAESLARQILLKT